MIFLMDFSSGPSKTERLWTKDFTIITLGTVVSMFGNAVAGFAIGLLVLDYTESVFLYAFFMVCYSLPRIVLPLFAGPYLDRFSRKKTIYTLDFVSCGLFLLVHLILQRGWFNYAVFVLFAMLVGSVDSIYVVAYDSFYPTLIAPGNFTRAYSVSSLIYPLATTLMVPVAAYFYKTIGLAPLFLFNAATFFIAAVAETQISASEQHAKKRESERFSAARFRADLSGGVSYLKRERGLLAISAYFFLTMLCGGLPMTLVLPYFRSLGDAGLEQYAVVMAAATAGRLLGGAAHYRLRFPPLKKFAVAVFVYLTISLFDGSFLFFPFAAMVALNLASGMLAITSYNIRISGTQNYVPDDMRGRFNGIFQMLNMSGMILGQLAAGALGEVLPLRALTAGAMAVNALGVFFILLPNRAHVKKIYNVDA